MADGTEGTEGFDPNGEPQGGEPEGKGLVKQLRKELKARDKEIAEAKQAKRELAFIKAGIDTSTKLGALFAKSFDGDLDPEKIKAEAIELGLLKVTNTDGEGEHDPDQSSRERSNLASGATADDGSGVDPRDAGLKRAEEALKKGATYDQAAGGFVAELAKAALNGDQRVILKGQLY